MGVRITIAVLGAATLVAGVWQRWWSFAAFGLAALCVAVFPRPRS